MSKTRELFDKMFWKILNHGTILETAPKKIWRWSPENGIVGVLTTEKVAQNTVATIRLTYKRKVVFRAILTEAKGEEQGYEVRRHTRGAWEKEF